MLSFLVGVLIALAIGTAWVIGYRKGVEDTRLEHLIKKYSKQIEELRESLKKL